MARASYSSYKDVPYYRKQGFFWLMYFIPFLGLVAIGLLLFGDIYYEKKGVVKSFGVANRVVAGIVAALILYGVFQAITGAAPRQPSLADQVRATSEQLNAQLPHRIDAATVLQTTSATGDTLMYRYDVSGAELVDSLAKSPQYVERIRAQVANGDCTNTDMRDSVLRLGIVARYEYADSTNRQLTSFDVKYADCVPSRFR